MSARRLRRRLLLYLAGLTILAALTVLARRGFPQGSPGYFAALGVAAASFAGALWIVREAPAASGRAVLLALAIALAMRVPLARMPVGAQSDLFRYLWDARLQRAGLNPYLIVPADPAVAHLHTAETRKMNNMSVPSPYPPAAQLLFRIATAGGESVYALRAAVIAADVVIGILLWRWLVWQGRSPLLVVAYAWNPLVAIEVADGHYDAIGALFVLVTAVALTRGRRLVTATSFALAVAMKFLPIVLAPILWRVLRPRHAVLVLLVLAALYAPYLTGTHLPLGSVSNVIDRFRFNAPVFQGVERLVGAHGAVAFAVLVGCAVAALPAVRTRPAHPAAWAWPMAATLVCSPLVYPWYLVWLTPFLVTRRTMPLLVWSISILPVYLVWELARRGWPWTVPPVLLGVEYVPVVIAGAWLAWKYAATVRQPSSRSRSPIAEPMRVSVVVPTRNERDAIGHVLGDVPSGTVSEVIVVDSQSSDGTPEAAAALGARVIREPRRGYGRACLTGLAAASEADVVVFLDGDYSDRPAELPRLIAPIREGHADIVIGSRLGGWLAPGAMPWHAVLGNRLCAWLIRSLCGVRLTDLGPFRAARVDVLRALALRETTYGWPVEMIVRGARCGYRIVEVPVSYYPRIGESKISGTVRGTVGAAYRMLTGILKYRFYPRCPME